MESLSPESAPICYLCGNGEHRRRPGKVRDDEKVFVLECVKCGLVFLSRRQLARGFYEQSCMHGEEAQPVDEWLRTTEADDARRYRYLSARLAGRDVLDFGCGAGGFILRARDSASSIAGVELETRLRPHFRANNLTVFEDLDQLPPDRRFDLITAFHVLEHLEDPVAKVALLAKRLKPEGLLVLEVPSPSDALLTLYKSRAFSEFTYWSCHLYLFTAANLETVGRKAGMTVDHVRNIQRYPLSNHLYWLANGKPGGHKEWSFLDDPVLDDAYEARLAALGITDTLIAEFRPGSSHERGSVFAGPHGL